MTDSVGTTYIGEDELRRKLLREDRPHWSPKFPILVRVHEGSTALTMHGPIGRETSCNACHLAHEPQYRGASPSDAAHRALRWTRAESDNPRGRLSRRRARREPPPPEAIRSAPRVSRALPVALVTAAIAVPLSFACSSAPSADDQITVNGPSRANSQARTASAPCSSGAAARSTATAATARAMRIYGQYGLRKPPGAHHHLRAQRGRRGRRRAGR